MPVLGREREGRFAFHAVAQDISTADKVREQPRDGVQYIRSGRMLVSHHPARQHVVEGSAPRVVHTCGREACGDQLAAQREFLGLAGE